MNHYTIVYTSICSSLLDEISLLRILHSCKRKTKQHNICSVLIHDNGHFVQSLQGTEEAVKTVYAGIKIEPCHSNVVSIYKGYTPELITTDKLAYRFVPKMEGESSYDFSELKHDHALLFSVLKDFAQSRHLNPTELENRTYKEALVEQVKIRTSVLQQKYKK